MNIKKYLIKEEPEQATQEQQVQKLKLASELGCLKNFTITNLEPIVSGNNKPYLIGTANNETFHITVNPEIIINVTQKNLATKDPTRPVEQRWACKNLNDLLLYIKELSVDGWSLFEPSSREIRTGEFITYNLKTGLTNNGKMPERGDKRFEKIEGYFEDVKEMLRNSTTGVVLSKREMGKKDAASVSYNEKDCTTALQNHVNYYLGTDSPDEQQYNQNKKILQQCVRQGLPVSANIELGAKPSIFGIVGKAKANDVNKIKDFFYNLPYPERDAQRGKYKLERPRALTESKIKNKVKNQLLEIKRKKNQTLTEINIVKSRLNLIIENLEDFKNYNRLKKVGVGFRYLREMSQLKKMGILNEELGNLFQQIFGKSLDSILTNVSEPLLTSIFDKLTLPEELKSNVIQRIHSKTTDLLASMDNCENLTTFLSNELSEALADHIIMSQKIGSDLLDSSLNELVKGEEFKQNLGIKLKENICALFEKFSENAKNLVTKLSEV